MTKKTIKYYISGKMRGMPDDNLPLFNKVAKDLRERGFEVFNPAENPHGLTWEQYMAIDIGLVCQSDAVIVIDEDWKRSPGANWEVIIGRDILKLPILRYPDLTPEPRYESPSQEAHRLVNGDRQGDYGHPSLDFACTAKMWSALTERLFGLPVEFKPEHVGLFMICVKLSREAHFPKRDNLTDIAGYANTIWMTHEEQLYREKLNNTLKSIKPDNENNS